MQYYFFFDTETNSLPKDYNAPASDTANWPRMVQVAWQIFNADKKLIKQRAEIIRHENIVLSEQAAAINGITQEWMFAEGRRLDLVLEEISLDLTGCGVIIGHNIKFDCGVLGAEFFREKRHNYLAGLSTICTMLNTVDLCKIPGKYGFKWPKLQEAYKYLFGSEFVGAHDALNDIRATSQIFFELQKRGYVLREGLGGERPL